MAYLTGCEINGQDLDIVWKFVLKLGGYAEGLFDYHDFGFSKSVLKRHLDQIEDDLRPRQEDTDGVRVKLTPPNLPPDAIWQDAAETWDYGQSLRFAAGVSMISANYRNRMTTDNLKRALDAKILHKCQLEILDDIIEKGRYPFIEARNLYNHCLASMIDPSFEISTFRKGLALTLKREQMSLFDLMTSITATFNKLFLESPHGLDLFYEMERVKERVILGQALSMFQQEPFLNLSRLKRISAGLWAPDPDVEWHERLSSYVTGATFYNLIDMCFLTEPASAQEISTVLRGWYYYDLVIAHLNHLVGLHKDLRSGIVNLALISVRESALVNLSNIQGYNPGLTTRDYERLFERTAEFSRRALATFARGQDDNEFYPFITIMIPVVMMAEWIGNRDEMIHSFLRKIAPSIRESVRPWSPALPLIAESVPTRAA